MSFASPLWISTALLVATYAAIMTARVNRAIVALIGAGLSFRPQEPWDLPLLGAISGVVHPIRGPLGLLILVLGIWGGVRAANHEWTDTEHGSHDSPAH